MEGGEDVSQLNYDPKEHFTGSCYAAVSSTFDVLEGEDASQLNYPVEHFLVQEVVMQWFLVQQTLIKAIDDDDNITSYAIVVLANHASPAPHTLMHPVVSSHTMINDNILPSDDNDLPPSTNDNFPPSNNDITFDIVAFANATTSPVPPTSLAHAISPPSNNNIKSVTVAPANAASSTPITPPTFNLARATIAAAGTDCIVTSNKSEDETTTEEESEAQQTNGTPHIDMI